MTILLVGIVLFCLLTVILLTRSNKRSDQSVLHVPSAPRDARALFSTDQQFFITGRGHVLTGTVQMGQIRIGDMVYWGETNDAQASVIAIESFKEKKESAVSGEQVGLVFSETLPQFAPSTLLWIR